MDEHNDLDLGREEGADPFRDVPPDAGEQGGVVDVSSGPEEERLGGEGATLGEEPAPEDVLQEPEERDVLAEGEEELPEAEPLEAPAAEAPAEEPPAEEPADEAPAPEGAKAKSKAKSKSGVERTYVVLSNIGPLKWEEPKKLAGKNRVKAANTAVALTRAYDILVPEGADEITLVAIAEHYWKEEAVAADIKPNRSIRIGKQ